MFLCVGGGKVSILLPERIKKKREEKMFILDVLFFANVVPGVLAWCSQSSSSRCPRDPVLTYVLGLQAGCCSPTAREGKPLPKLVAAVLLRNSLFEIDDDDGGGRRCAESSEAQDCVLLFLFL